MRRSWCTRCEAWKPVTDFSPKAYHADGSPAMVLSRCKPCLAELARIRRREDPEWAKRVNQRDWERIKADPEKLERRRELTRENCTVHRRRKQASAAPSVDELRDEAQKEQWRVERAARRVA